MRYKITTNGKNVSYAYTKASADSAVKRARERGYSVSVEKQSKDDVRKIASGRKRK